MNFSLEISPRTEIESLPPVKDVYITLLPGGDYKEIAQKSGDLVNKGFNPVPHFPARSIKNENELQKLLKQTAYGNKIFIGMGAGSISNWIRKIPRLI